MNKIIAISQRSLLVLVYIFFVIQFTSVMPSLAAEFDDVIEFERPDDMKKLKPGSYGKLFTRMHSLILTKYSGRELAPGDAAMRDNSSDERVSGMNHYVGGYLEGKKKTILPRGIKQRGFNHYKDIFRALKEVALRGYQATTCAIYNRSYEDMRVPGHEKTRFLVHELGYVCLFWPLKSKHYYWFDIYLSERCSRDLGHKPMKDFEKMAFKIFQSVRFLSDKLEMKTH